MTTIRRAVAALALTFLLVAAPMSATAAPTADSVNWSSDQAPEIYKHVDTETIAVHDRADMSNPLEYYDDGGEVKKLPAHLNATQDEPVSVRLDKIEADRYQLFPRVSGESENKHTFLNASNWTTSTSDATNVSPTLSDADGVTASGVPAVKFTTTGMAAGDTATASFGESVSITTDPDKRVLLFVGSVPTLPAGSSAEIRAVDSDGDYRYAEINTSADASDANVIANTTTESIFFQSRMNDLALGGSGDGNMGEISKVEIVTAEDNVEVQVIGLDLDGKSVVDIGETMKDTDGDGDTEATTIQTYTDGGALSLTSLDSLAGWTDSARIHDLQVHNVRYGIQDLNESDYRVKFGNASDYGSYEHDLEVEAPLVVPTAIDISHGTITLRGDQKYVSERYAEFGVAEDIGSNKNTSDVNESDYTDKKSVFSQKGETHTVLSSGISAGSTDFVQIRINLLNSEFEALARDSSAVVGPVGGSNGFLSGIPVLGGLINFIMTPIGAAVGTILGLVGLGKKMG